MAVAGSVAGSVKFEGVAPKGKPIDMAKEPACAKAYSTPATTQQLVTGPNGSLANVLVYVSEGAPDKKFDPPSTTITIEQKNCMYLPHVIGLEVNQKLRVVNSDSNSHNIHPLPKNNHEWNKSQPPGSPPFEEHFDQPEVVIPVKCNIHPWMRSYIAVLKNPYYAITGEDGSFTIKNLPPGTYTLSAWQESHTTQTQQITVAGNKPVTANFVFKGR